jgi:ribosomal-protein-alanine N-acetyltransferase
MDVWPRPRPAGSAPTDAPWAKGRKGRKGRTGSYRIRSAEPADLLRVAEIEGKVFSDPWPEAGFRDLLGPFARVVVTENGLVVGYLFARCATDQAEILNLAIHPSHLRRGLGTALVRGALQNLARAGARRVYLEVRASNRGAQAFYRRLGFVVGGRRRGYYSKPTEDALVLCRVLGEV